MSEARSSSTQRIADLMRRNPKPRLTGAQDRALRRIDRRARRTQRATDRARVIATALIFQVQNGAISPQEALGLEPRDAEGFARYGAHLLALGRKQDALASAEVATALDPAHTGAWLVRACASARLGQVAQALLCYGQAARLEPRNIRAWTDAAELHLDLLDFQSAAECLKKAIELDPKAETAAGRRAFVLVATTYYGEEE